jgi:hypothetical protein
LGASEGAGGANRARGATWWWSSYPQPHAKTTSKKPRQATKSKRHADSGRFTCTRATRANPHRHSSESKDETWVANRHLAQFRISASRSRYFKPPQIFARIRPAALQASPACPDSALDRSALRDLKATQTGDVASNNLKDKRRTTNSTRPSLKPVKNEGALLLPDIRLDRRHVRLERSSLLYFVSGRHGRCDLRIRCRCAFNHARTYDTTCQGVRITPIRCRSSLRWWRWECARGR